MSYADRRCDTCQKDYEPVKAWQRFCSAECRESYWQSVRELAKIANRQRVLSPARPSTATPPAVGGRE